ncbi:MAG: hypothetical protein IKT29_03325 [Flavobacteriales bacterium]|nr:hypothetical protein [Flavobacteriales bacterium]
MKKLFLIALMTFFTVSYASAQWTTYYVVEQEGEEYPSQSFFKIDWSAKYFFLDSDSEDETKCPMKNFKESGGKKTFDVYYTKSVGGGKYCSVVFVTDANGKMTLTQTMPGEGGKTLKMTYILSDKKPMKDAAGDVKNNPKGLLKGGVDKVKGLFKKKNT